MNVVIYARYSSVAQGEASIEGQLKECREYCERKGYTIVDEYVDRALTGRSDKRPEFMRMIVDSKKEFFQAVIVYEFSRFSRNRYDSVLYKTELKKNGVRVISIHTELNEEDPSSVLIEGIFESLDQFYSERLAQVVSRGMRLSAEKCLAMGTVPFGYMVDENRKYQINPETAPAVEYIYKEYAKGSTIKEITDHLNAQGYKTSMGGKFNKNSLRTILKSKRYIGVYSYSGIETAGGMPRIISDELFEKVAKRLEKNRKAPARYKAIEEYLLTTKLYCGHCKEMMTGFSGTGKKGKRYHYYICNNRKKKKCDKEMVSKHYIENLVVSVCQKLLTDENIDKISKEVVRIYETGVDKSRLNELKRKMSENERKQSNLLEAIMDCDDRDLRQTFYSKMSKLEEEHKEIEKEYVLEQKSQPEDLTESKVRFYLKALRDGDINDIKYKRLLIDVFVNSIYIYDEKITFVFNSNDEPVTMDEKLLSEIEDFYGGETGLFLDKSSPSKKHFKQKCFFML